MTPTWTTDHRTIDTSMRLRLRTNSGKKLRKTRTYIVPALGSCIAHVSQQLAATCLCMASACPSTDRGMRLAGPPAGLQPVHASPVVVVRWWPNCMHAGLLDRRRAGRTRVCGYAQPTSWPHAAVLPYLDLSRVCTCCMRLRTSSLSAVSHSSDL